MIIIAILVGLCAGAATFFLIDHFSVNRNLPISQFKREQAKALQGLVEKKNAVDKEFDEETERRHREKKQQLQADYEREKTRLDTANLTLKQMYDDQKQQLEDDYIERTNKLKFNYDATQAEYNQKALAATQKRQIELQEQIEKEQRRLHAELDKLSADYKDKKDRIEKDFFVVSEQINSRKAALTEEIERYEARQNEIIARFKEDERKREQADFYRIKVSEIEKQDISKLKALSTSFSKPEILLKLIYETYYKSRLEELFKRVLGENKDKGGIYKITNINNQKVYIGKTVSFISRWRTHAKRGCGIERIKGQLYDAMFEDGLENYTWEIVEVCPKEEQTEKEKYWIGFYKSNEYGYNQKLG